MKQKFETLHKRVRGFHGNNPESDLTRLSVEFMDQKQPKETKPLSEYLKSVVYMTKKVMFLYLGEADDSDYNLRVDNQTNRIYLSTKNCLKGFCKFVTETVSSTKVLREDFYKELKRLDNDTPNSRIERSKNMISMPVI